MFLLQVPKENLATKTALCLRFAVWNVQSVNGKSGSICDFVISNRLDLLALSETWLSRMEEENITIAEITGNLQDYDFFHLPRSGRGGGMGLLLRKGFTLKLNEVIEFKFMEYMDFNITTHSSTFRLVVIYRTYPSKKNKQTASMFFEDFSVLLEDLVVSSEHCSAYWRFKLPHGRAR